MEIIFVYYIPRWHADYDSSRQTTDDERFVLDILSEWKSTLIPALITSTLPDELIEKMAEILRKGSILYRYDVDSISGTTATAIAEWSEEMAYWAFDLLVSIVSSSQRQPEESEAGNKSVEKGSDVGSLVQPALMRRFEETLRRFVQDIKLRGRLPLERSVSVFRRPTREVGRWLIFVQSTTG